MSVMALERRDNAGGAVDTTITATINSTDLSITIASATGWPSGGASGPFFVIIDYDQAQAGREKVEIASRTGTTLTVASVGKRGIDDTTAQTHQSGAQIRHCFTAQDGDEANRTMAETIGKVTTKGDMIVATGANAFGRLPVGSNNQAHLADSGQATGTKWAAIDSTTVTTTGTPSTILPDDAAAAGSGAGLAKVDHKHAIAAATAVSVGSANAEGTSSSFARADHTHDLIAASVAAGDIANGAINDENLFSATLSPIIIASSNPGAVGADRFWFNTTKLTFLKRNAADTAWAVIANLGPHIDYTPTLTNVTLGTGGFNKARYTRMGSTVLANGRVVLGTGGDITGIISVGLPPTALAVDLSGSYAEVMLGHSGARARILGGGQGYAAVGVVQHDPGNTDEISFFATAGYAAWDSVTPVNWVPTDSFSWFVEYEAASAEDANFV